MTRKTLIAIAAMTAALGTAAAAQGVQMTIRPDSKLVLDGSSNVHDWACKSSDFIATVEVDAAFPTRPLTDVARPISTVQVTIPVKTLKCGHKKMDENMYKALKADEFPDIKYALTTYTIDDSTATEDSFVARTTGQLTVSGQAITVDIPITVKRTATGAARGEGTVSMLMTDFGIKPPVALLGTLRTRNKISISFNVLLDKGTLVALSQPQ
jgi:polyisoprenoid-binding protein YceI